MTDCLIEACASEKQHSDPESQIYRICSSETCDSNGSAISREYQPYSVYSKDVGWNEIDILIKELDRQATSSLFFVPDISDRTTMESQFAMCAFSQATLLRGFTHWVLSARPQGDSNEVWVGFYSASIDDAENQPILLPDGRQHPGANSWSEKCQFFDPVTGETSNKSFNRDGKAAP